jgi:hypothetical protein
MDVDANDGNLVEMDDGGDKQMVCSVSPFIVLFIRSYFVTAENGR